jgi:hypothetical protein
MRLVLILLGLVLSQPVWAEWTKIGSPAQVTFYVDFGTVKKTATGRRAWILHDRKTPFQTPNGDAFSMAFLNEYDCADERHRTLQFTAYSEAMGRGKSLGGSSDVREWSVPVPQSVAAYLLKAVCFSPLPE